MDEKTDLHAVTGPQTGFLRGRPLGRRCSGPDKDGVYLSPPLFKQIQGFC